MRFGAIWLMIFCAGSGVAGGREVFDFEASLMRIPRARAGHLHIDAQGVVFESTDGKTRVSIPMSAMREADVADARALRFETYDAAKRMPMLRQEYRFRAASDAPLAALAQFLTGNLYRPVVGSYTASSRFQVAAYHRRALSGSSGMLEIGEDSIRFVSDKGGDSRTWLYRDIETIGRPDAFRFRVTTARETYVMELKAALPAGAYDFAWARWESATAR